MMICTALVLFMTIPGIALFYGGLIRGKKSDAVDADAGDGDVCTGLYSLGGFTVTRWRLVRGNNFFGNINWLMLKKHRTDGGDGQHLSVYPRGVSGARLPALPSA
ncbi:hypothetical protein ACP0HM_34310 [Escherichia coli]